MIDDKIAVLMLRQSGYNEINAKCYALNVKYGNKPDMYYTGEITNFAEARNDLQKAMLERYPETEWFLWIDSDEVFPWEIIIRPLAIQFKNDYSHWTIPFYDSYWFGRYNLFPDEEHYRIDANCFPDIQCRLFRSDLKWKGKVHESVGGRWGYTDVKIYHYGWLKSESFQKQKHDRFHQIAGKPPDWQFPKLSEVSLKKLPEEKVIRLE